MTRIADGSVIIQTTASSVPSTPSWFGEVVLMATHLCKHGVLTKMSEQVRFARRRGLSLRRDRFSRGPLRLCHQRGTYPGRVLRADPALCSSVHGFV